MSDRDNSTSASIDLGSNSFHMVVARYQNGELTIIDRIKEMVRLGDGIDSNNHLCPDVQARALACLERFGERLSGFPAKNVRAVGTNTLRNAENANDFLIEAETALGFPIDIISGVEEARLIYLGVAQNIAAEGQRRFIMDIGGGSTELIIGSSEAPEQMVSLEMGCVSVTRRFFEDGAITAKRLEQASRFAQSELAPHIENYLASGWQQIIGASGTIKAVNKVVNAEGWSNSGITIDSLRKLLTALGEARQINNIKCEGLDPERAPVFIGGVIVLLSTFEALGIKEMTVSDRALREGLILDLEGRFQGENTRRNSVDNLAKRYHAELSQSQRVSHTAINLMQQVADAWQLDNTEAAKWLNWASQLHEIGLGIAHRRYHHHGAYIIEHCDLAGFTQQEQQLLAVLVRSHLRKLPLTRFKALPKRTRKLAKKLSILLRLSVILHRNRSSAPTPKIRATAESKSITLNFPKEWLANHPLTSANLAQEEKYLTAIDYNATFL
ncbi:MAG: exopolyphosphatase [Thiotrichaceae bacterium]|nr:exopolyphosphatase [Thiotrichaceae bacterium]